MILLIFPNQLYRKHPGLKRDPERIVLLEDSLFFGDPLYPARFHKQKLWLHRASMKRYQADLADQGYETRYRDYDQDCPLVVDQLKQELKSIGRHVRTLCAVDPTDFILQRRIKAACDQLGLELELLPNPGFINSPEQNHKYRAGKKRWFMADFYKWQRTRLDILIDGDDAIVQGESWLWHSVLTPALNIGLITPDEVVKATLRYAKNNDVPINSLEGFLVR